MGLRSTAVDEGELFPKNSRIFLPFSHSFNVFFSIYFFYDRFVFFEKLKPEDRERTHILSSFFYKRLTQKNNDSDNRVRLVNQAD